LLLQCAHVHIWYISRPSNSHLKGRVSVGWTRLPYNPLLLVPPQGVHYLHMGEKHTPAAVFVYSQVIHDFAGRLSLDALPVFLPYMGYHFAAGKAPDWYQAVSPVGLLVPGPGTKAAELLPSE